MRINTAGDVVQSQFQARAASQPAASFQDALDTAKQKLLLANESPQSPGKAGPTSQAAPMTAGQELAEYMRKSPIQHMRDAILKRMGLTEESLNAMPPEQRAAVEKTIAAKIKEELLGHGDNTQFEAVKA